MRAFPIAYPNSLDNRAGRNGYGIWFHGLIKPLKPQDTNGCIALDNRNIDELASYIKLNETPTIITSKIEWVAPKNLKKEKEELENIIETWRRSWERKEIDRYISLYSSRFTSGGKNWRQWKNYKILQVSILDTFKRVIRPIMAVIFQSIDFCEEIVIITYIIRQSTYR